LAAYLGDALLDVVFKVDDIDLLIEELSHPERRNARDLP
jgi:hypothetical protein